MTGGTLQEKLQRGAPLSLKELLLKVARVNRNRFAEYFVPKYVGRVAGLRGERDYTGLLAVKCERWRRG